MEKTERAAVVIPFYKNTLTTCEKISLAQCLKILGRHPLIAIKPETLDLSQISRRNPFAEIKSFADHYFENIEGYNKLMLAPEFYAAFPEYEFILIHQLDAFVFRDELDFWVNKGFDYIGAPWIRPIDDPDVFKTIKTRLQTFFHTRYDVYENGLPSPKQFENQVGNGGFSLRRVKKFRVLSEQLADKIALYHLRTEHQFHEDAFWSIEVNRKKKLLHIPNYRIALRFAFENAPDRAYRLAGQLPFGCHAWDKNPGFWKQHMEAGLFPPLDSVTR